MPLPSIFNPMGAVLKGMLTDEILRTNEVSQKYGLTLSAAEAREIVEARGHVLQSYGRVELDMGVTRKLIGSFCTSPFINQEDYPSTLKELQEIFYYMKNETEDRLGDDELIGILKDFFENDCGGSIELLQGRELEAFARKMRCGSRPVDDEEEGANTWGLKL